MYLLYLAAKLIGVLLLILIPWAIKRHRAAVKRMKFYEKQGASCVPGYKRFLIGNAGQLVNTGLACQADQSKWSLVCESVLEFKQF